MTEPNNTVWQTAMQACVNKGEETAIHIRFFRVDQKTGSASGLYEQVLVKDIGSILQGRNTLLELGAEGYVYMVYACGGLARELKAAARMKVAMKKYLKLISIDHTGPQDLLIIINTDPIGSRIISSFYVATALPDLKIAGYTGCLNTLRAAWMQARARRDSPDGRAQACRAVALAGLA